MSNKKVVLITGTSSGFGFIAAQQLAQKAYTVYASMRGVDSSNKAAAEALKTASSHIHVVELDVTKEVQINALVAQIVAEQGQIDIVINNAGLMNVGISEAYSLDQHYAQMEVNYFGPARIFKAVLPHMRAAKSGLLLTVTSLAGRLVFPAFTTYSASKFAAEALAEGYRYELSPFNVDSVILEPGPFKTQLINNSPKPDNEQVVSAYGEHGQRLNGVLAGFDTFYEQEGEGLANPQTLVNDMINLIESPYGQRPLRTVSGVDYGTRALNETSAPVQQGILEALGMTDLDPHKPLSSIAA